jgi:hypothetical protein
LFQKSYGFASDIDLLSKYLWDKWTINFDSYCKESLFIRPILLDFSKLGVNPTVACGIIVLVPS